MVWLESCVLGLLGELVSSEEEDFDDNDDE